MISQKKILVVEDNEINRAMLSEILSSEYQVLEAENGAVALDVLKEYGEGISLILLDIIMPVMDGYTFLAHVKADQAYSSIPVIVTTQSDGESDEVAALSHGAADFVAKPYRPQIIQHRVASIINLRTAGQNRKTYYIKQNQGNQIIREKQNYFHRTPAGIFLYILFPRAGLHSWGHFPQRGRGTACADFTNFFAERNLPLNSRP